MRDEQTLESLHNFIMMAELVSGYTRIAKVGLAAEKGEITHKAAMDNILLIGHQVMDAIKPTIDKMEKYNGTAN